MLPGESPNFGKRLGKINHAAKFVFRLHGRPLGMVAVLFAISCVESYRLHMAAGIRANPHVR